LIVVNEENARRTAPYSPLVVLASLLLAGLFLVVKFFEYRHKLHNGVFWGAAYHPSEEMLASLPPSLRGAAPQHMGIVLCNGNNRYTNQHAYYE
jgi:hypothetical protein